MAFFEELSLKYLSSNCCKNIFRNKKIKFYKGFTIANPHYCCNLDKRFSILKSINRVKLKNCFFKFKLHLGQPKKSRNLRQLTTISILRTSHKNISYSNRNKKKFLNFDLLRTFYILLIKKLYTQDSKIFKISKIPL